MTGSLAEGSHALGIEREPSCSVGESLGECPHSGQNLVRRHGLDNLSSRRQPMCGRMEQLLVADNVAQLPVNKLNCLLGKHIVPETIRRQHNHITVL